MSDGEGKKLFRTALVLAFLITLSKVVGLARDVLIAHFYGTTDAAVAFETASRLPTLLFDLLLGGIITAALVPAFNRTLVKDGRDDAFSFGAAYTNVILLGAAVITTLGILFASPLVHLLAPELPPPVHDLSVHLTRILLPTVFCLGATFCLVGILQSLGSFRLPASISLFSGLPVIFYLLFLNRRFGVEGLAVTMLFASFLQGAILCPRLRKLGYRHLFTVFPAGNTFKDTLRTAFPLLIASWAVPLSTFVQTRFASGIEEGRAITALSYANKLYLILVGILSFVITNLLFPKLSRAAALEDGERSRNLLAGSLRSLVFLTLPVAIAVVLYATPAVTFLFQHGAFTVGDTALTANALAILSGGMLFAAISEVLTKALFAYRKTFASMLAALSAMALNILLTVCLSTPFGIRGLALATAASSGLLVLLDFLIAAKMQIFTLTKKDLSAYLKSFAASLLTGTVLFFLRQPLSTFSPFITVLTVGASLFPLHLCFAFLLGCDEVKFLRQWFFERKKVSV